MGKSRKVNSKRRNRKTRRYKLKGGRETKAALYVWKNPDDKTFHKRIFVDEGMDYGDSIADAGYQLRWFAGEGGNTIPRKPAGTDKFEDIKPYVKYLTADYGDGNGEVNTRSENSNQESSVNVSEYEPITPGIRNKAQTALNTVRIADLKRVVRALGIQEWQNGETKQNLIDRIIPNILGEKDADMM